MSVKYLLGHEKLMKLCKRLGENYSKTNAVDLNFFVTHYFASTSRSNLSDRGNDSMYDNLRQAWPSINSAILSRPRSNFCTSIPAMR